MLINIILMLVMKMSSMIDFLMFILFLLGVIFLIVGLGIRKNYKRKLEKCDVHTVAKVLGNVKERVSTDDGNMYSYFPVIQFYVNDKAVKQKLTIGYSKKLEIGSSLEIMYESNKPNNVLIIEKNPQRKIYRIFMGIGMIMLFICLIIQKR